MYEDVIDNQPAPNRTCDECGYQWYTQTVRGGPYEPPWDVQAECPHCEGLDT